METAYIVMNSKTAIEHEITFDGKTFFYNDCGVHRAISREALKNALCKAEEMGWYVFDYTV